MREQHRHGRGKAKEGEVVVPPDGVIGEPHRAPLKPLGAVRVGPGRSEAARARREPSLGRPNRPFGLRQPLDFKKVGDHEGHLDRLLRIEARIAIGVVPVVQIRLPKSRARRPCTR